MNITTRPLRLSDELAAALDEASAKIGLSANDLVIDAIRRLLGMTDASEVDFLNDLSDWIRSNFDAKTFPQDVTKRLFDHIVATPTRLKTYKKLLLDEKGKLDPHQRQRLNQRLGAMVKRVLNAEVGGRLGPFDPDS